MPIKLIKDDVIRVPVTLRNPHGVEFKFTATYEYMPRNEFDDLTKNCQDEEVIDKVVKGWEGWKDMEGNVVDYSNEEIRQAVLNEHWVVVGLIRNYVLAIQGKARTKN